MLICLLKKRFLLLSLLKTVPLNIFVEIIFSRIIWWILKFKKLNLCETEIFYNIINVFTPFFRIFSYIYLYDTKFWRAVGLFIYLVIKL